MTAIRYICLILWTVAVFGCKIIFKMSNTVFSLSTCALRKTYFFLNAYITVMEQYEVISEHNQVRRKSCETIKSNNYLFNYFIIVFLIQYLSLYR